jgi:pyrimidine-nucleoside phosphorylase
MLVSQLIAKKRDGRTLSEAEINYLVSGYTKGEIPDYQFSAFLMAAYLRGLDGQETFSLAKAMLNSGKIVDLSIIYSPKIDKHSTGGVGDKVSLILAPLVAACGVTVPMVSGRGLGHTGGTLDKLESIPGFRTDLSIEEFKSNLEQIGLCLIGQTEEIAPADKKIYALRDVTGTVEFIPFITASILSKKLAEGADGIVFDVKVSRGAFMKTASQARALARSLISIGKKFKKKMTAVLTDMSEPLGQTVGNSLEVVEAIEALKGNWQPDLKEVTYFLGAEMLILAGKCKSYPQAYQMLYKANQDGSALETFRQMVKLQGGDTGIIEDYLKLPQAKVKYETQSARRGYIKEIQADQIGWLAIEIGAGRKRKEDQIDPAAGFVIRKKIGERVQKGEVLAEIHCPDQKLAERIGEQLKKCFVVSQSPAKKPKKIIRRITAGGESTIRQEILPE